MKKTDTANKGISPSSLFPLSATQTKICNTNLHRSSQPDLEQGLICKKLCHSSAMKDVLRQPSAGHSQLFAHSAPPLQGWAFDNLTDKPNNDTAIMSSTVFHFTAPEPPWWTLQKESRKWSLQTVNGLVMEGIRTKAIRHFIDHTYAALEEETKHSGGCSKCVYKWIMSPTSSWRIDTLTHLMHWANIIARGWLLGFEGWSKALHFLDLIMFKFSKFYINSKNR